MDEFIKGVECTLNGETGYFLTSKELEKAVYNAKVVKAFENITTNFKNTTDSKLEVVPIKEVSL